MAKKKPVKKKKTAKKRAPKYEKKLKIEASFDDVLRMTFKKPH